MKKQLLASTMLVAAGALGASSAANAKFDVTVNGYQEAIVGFSFQGDTEMGHKTSAADVDFDGEIHFNARTELDNGIAIRAHIELEGGAGGAGGTGDTIDEEYIIVRGNFGQFLIGSEDHAGHLMTIGYTGSWATQVGQNLNFDIEDFMTTGGRARENIWNSRLSGYMDDAELITYYSPRMGGFQIGVSYISNFEQDNNAPPDTEDPGIAGWHDGISIGVNFQRKFGNFGLGAGAGYIRAAKPEGATGDDLVAWNAAARFDFGPARIAVGYKKIDETPFNSSIRTGTTLDLGGRLTFGPNAFSLTYLSGEDDADNKQQRGMLSYARTLGPGVKWTANLMYNNWEPNGAASVDGSALTTSILLNF